MTAKVVQIPNPARMECSSCGATANAACGCGVAYVPASTRAREAIAKNPEKSDRALAADLGIGKDSVRRARDKLTGAHAPVDEKRIGRDGKARRMPRRQTPDNDTLDPEFTAEMSAEEQWQTSVANMAGDA